MTTNPTQSRLRTPRHHLVSALFVAVLLGLGRVAPLAAQSRYSPQVMIGFGLTPARLRHGGVAGSLALFRRLGSVADLGIETGFQHFGAPVEETFSRSLCLPPSGDPCLPNISSAVHRSGELWHVGPTLRLHLLREGAIRPVALVGLGLYGENSRFTQSFRDSTGQAIPALPTLRSVDKFEGLGANVGVGVEGGRVGRFRWVLGVRAHAAIGSIDGDLSSVEGYSLMLGVTLP